MKMRFISVFLTVVFLMSIFSLNVFATDTTTSTNNVPVGLTLYQGKSEAILIKADGNIKPMKLSATPIVVKGNTLIPLKTVADAFGAQTQWVQSTKQAIIIYNQKCIILTVNSKTASVNGTQVQMPVAAQTTKGCTMIPLKFISDNMGFPVKWHSTDKRITIGYDYNLDIRRDSKNKISKIFTSYTDNSGVSHGLSYPAGTPISTSTNDGIPIGLTIYQDKNEAYLVQANGNINQIKLDVAPFAMSGYTLVPLKTVADTFGATVQWLQSNNQVVITSGQKNIVITLNSPTATVNGTQVKMPGYALQLNGCTMIPLKFLSDNLGYATKWHKSDKRITIGYDYTLKIQRNSKKEIIGISTSYVDSKGITHYFGYTNK